MAKASAKTGGFLAGAGCIFGLAPLTISFAAAAVGSDLGNELHWLTLLTAPVGAVVVIVGLIIAIVGANKRTALDFDESATASQGQAHADVAGIPANSKATELPPLPTGLARSVKLAYAVGFGIVLVSGVMRVTLFQPGSGLMNFFDLIPAFFAGWFVVLARDAHNGLHFLRLHQTQLIVSTAGCVAGTYPLIYLVSDFDTLWQAEDPFQWGGTIITGLIPLAASVASLVFARVARTTYRRRISAG